MPAKKKVIPKGAAPSLPPRRRLDLDTFAADALDWIGNGHWTSFVASMEGQGYSEAECEDAAVALSKRAGRVG